MRTVYLNASYFPASRLLSAIRTAAILIFGGYQVLDGNIEVGVLIAFVGYLQRFFDPIQQISQLYTTYQQGMAALDKIFDLLDTEPDTVDQDDAIEPGQIRGEIDLEESGSPTPRTTRRGRAAPAPGSALSNRTAAIRSRSRRGPRRLGAAGRRPARAAGSDRRACRRDRRRQVSTLAKLIALLRPVAAGTHPRRRHRRPRARLRGALRSQLGIVPQEGFLFSGTIADNVASAAPNLAGGDHRGTRGGRRQGDAGFDAGGDRHRGG